MEGEDLGDLEEIKNAYLEDHPEGEHAFNESTADFNKEIRLINQELRGQDPLPLESSIHST